MAKKSVWTPDKDRELIAIWPRGLTLSDTAAALGLARNTVYWRAKQLKLPKRRRPEKAEVGTLGDMRTKEARNRILKGLTPVFVGLLVNEPISYRPFPKCCFIVNDTKPYKYCDAPSIARHSMCDAHHKLTTRAPNSYEERILKEIK